MASQLLRKPLAAMLLAICAGTSGYCADVADANGEPKLAVGQEWSVKGLSGSPIKVVIGRIEPWRDKIAVHVSVIDIPASFRLGDLRIAEIAHMPFEMSALANSVDKLLATGVQPARDFESGYGNWKEHHGGIYSVSLASLLNDDGDKHRT